MWDWTRSRRDFQINSQASPTSGPTGARRGLILAIATAGGAGYAPIAPGTFGSAVGVAVFFALAPAGIGWIALVAVALLGIGVWAAEQAERVFGRKDDGRIVIDEVVGQVLALAPLAALAPGLRRHPGLLLLGFLVFRLLDIWKPGPVRRAERGFPGGLGVMLDDVLAGLLAATAMLAAGVALAVTSA